MITASSPFAGGESQCLYVKTITVFVENSNLLNVFLFHIELYVFNTRSAYL